MKSFQTKKIIPFIFLVISIFALSGCAKLRHLPRLLTLKGYAENKMDQDEYVAEQKVQFNKLLEAVKSGKIDEYITKEQFVTDFGEPIVARPKEKDGKVYDMWMYRFAGSIRSAQKVYLYFDEVGNLQEWEHYIPKKLKNDENMKYRGGPG